jgi:hypothetical protein
VPATPPDLAALVSLRGLIVDYDHAVVEIARLSRGDDLGSGERTARLSSLGAWETHQARLAARIAAVAGDVTHARAIVKEAEER